MNMSDLPAKNVPVYSPNSTEGRALSLLGSGVTPEIVAASVGVSLSRISQLLSDEQFAAQVAELRFESVQKYNRIDGVYDSMEEQLLERLKDCIGLMHRPLEILKAIQIINAAKRRGASTPAAITEKTSIINLVMPVKIINKFQTNQQGQVTRIGDTDLLTIQSGSLERLVNSEKENNDGRPALAAGEVRIEKTGRTTSEVSR